MRHPPKTTRIDRASASTASTASTADRVAQHEEMQRALRTLTPKQRPVLVLRHYEGLSDPQIAELLGCGEISVRTHAIRGRERMRIALDMSQTPFRQLVDVATGARTLLTKDTNFQWLQDGRLMAQVTRDSQAPLHWGEFTIFDPRSMQWTSSTVTGAPDVSTDGFTVSSDGSTLVGIGYRKGDKGAPLLLAAPITGGHVTIRPISPAIDPVELEKQGAWAIKPLDLRPDGRLIFQAYEGGAYD